VIATSPDATRADTACAWCEQPLDADPPRLSGPVRCLACGATMSSWLAATDDAAQPAPRAHAAPRLCSLGEAARRRARRNLAARIARIAPPGPVLDVASGDGMLLDALRAAGRIATGIERPATRAGVRDADITELGGRYAAIVFWQSLGRLRAPGTALEHAAALLKPGGLLAIAQPSPTRHQARALGARWLAREPAPTRIHIPPRALLERLHLLGLQIERVDHLLDRRAGGRLHGVLGGILAVEARR
jgi:hypothetical protein